MAERRALPYSKLDFLRGLNRPRYFWMPTLARTLGQRREPPGYQERSSPLEVEEILPDQKFARRF